MGILFGLCVVSQVLRLLEILQPNASDIIYDLGSGGGKVVLLAALMSPATVVGIELVQYLAQHIIPCPLSSILAR